MDQPVSFLGFESTAVFIIDDHFRICVSKFPGRLLYHFTFIIIIFFNLHHRFIYDKGCMNVTQGIHKFVRKVIFGYMGYNW